MKNNYFFIAIFTFIFLFAASSSQAGNCDSIKSTFSASNANRGCMFSIVAKSKLTVKDFYVLITSGTAQTGTDTLIIFYKSGSCKGFDKSPSAWKRFDSLPFTKLKVTDTLFHFYKPLNHSMNANDTLAFYISFKKILDVRFINGTAINNMFSQNNDIQMLEGYGNAFPFGASNNPRMFDGIVNYCRISSVGIEEHVFRSSELFPNPMNSTATLKISENIDLTDCKLTIVDISGRIVKQVENISSRETTINRQELTNGLYFYSLTENNNVVSNGKLVIAD